MVNWRRASPVFQFITRDYSRNNSTTNYTIDSYNEHNLPTHLKVQNSYINLFYSVYIKEMWIYYDCDAPAAGSGPVHGKG